MTDPSHPGAVLAAALKDDEQQTLDAMRKWLDRDVRPRVLELEHGDVYPSEMVEQVKAAGLFGATIARQCGGLSLCASSYARIVMNGPRG